MSGVTPCAVALPALYCPVAPAVSPHAEAVQRASVAWARDVGLVRSEAAAEKLGRARIGWLVARGFPRAGAVDLQIAADWTTLFCALDDRAEALEPMALAVWSAGLVRAFRDGAVEDTDAGEPCAPGLRELRARMRARAGGDFVARFAARLEDILLGFTWEALHRRAGAAPDVRTYRALREVTVGLHAEFALAELTDGVALPPAVADAPALRALATSVALAVGFANDLFTFERERAAGELHNVVLVLMDREGAEVRTAVARAARLHDDEVRRFEAGARALPDAGAWGPMRARYVDVLASWLRGHLDWARETGRYRATHNAPADADPSERATLPLLRTRA